MRYLLLSSVIAAAVCCSPTILANTPSVADVSNQLMPTVRVDSRQYTPQTIDQALAQFNLPGLSVAVIKNGELVWAQGFGVANKKTNQGVTTETLFQAGSISKPIAALAILKLAQDGKINLDADINQYLVKWKIPAHEFGDHAVTIRQILTHSAGLTQHGFPGYSRGSKLPDDVAVLMGEGNTGKVYVDTQPGSTWRYSGGGYTVLDLLVEDVTKMSFADYVDSQILAPLGMSHSTFAQPLPKAKWGNASAAFNYSGEQITGDWHEYPEQAAAGLWTTPSDLAKYIIAVQQAYQGKTVGPLTPELVKQMLTLHINNWGLGPSLEQKGQGLVFGHGGKNAGFTNNMRAYVELGDGFIVMSNGDSAGPVLSKVQTAISSYYGWDLAEPKILTEHLLDNDTAAQLSGDYRYDQDSKFTLKVSQQGNQFELFDVLRNRKMPFIGTAENTLTGLYRGIEVTIVKNDKGEVMALLWDKEHKFSKL